MKKTADEWAAELTAQLEKMRKKGVPDLSRIGVCLLCKTHLFADGLCATHHIEFAAAPEYARVKTAIADWQRRVALEKG